MRENSILIRNGRVWDGEAFAETDILVEGRKITKIASRISDDAEWVYDATGKIVSAGLVDLHTHLRGISLEKYGVVPDMACFPFGVTAAADCGGLYGNRELLDTFSVKTKVFAVAEVENNHAQFDRTKGLLEAYGSLAAGVKIYFDSSGHDLWDRTPLEEVCRFAHDRGLKVMVHSSHSPVPMPRLLEVLEGGDILTHGFHGSPNHGAADHFEAMKNAQKRGVVVDVGFAGHVHTDFGIFREAIQEGVLPDVISTDITRLSAYRRGGRYGMTLCLSMAKALGMEEKDIFRRVTVNPARVLGEEGNWGCLKTNGNADIAVFANTREGFDLTDGAGNRIHSDEGYRCVLTISNGMVVYRD